LDYLESAMADFVCEYSGFVPPPGWTVDRVSPDIDPKVFFEQYVAARKPAFFDSFLTDPEWKVHLWDNAYLKEKAGDRMVRVNQKGSAGNYVTNTLGVPTILMSYREFIGKLESGNDNLYLATQNREPGDESTLLPEEEELADFLPAPGYNLKSDFPMRPKILGNMIPARYNMWMGNSKNGSSSGLHHDDADNIYILLRGKKRFTIFPPVNAPLMYTYGEVAYIHPNGLINYKGFPTRSDCLPESDVIKFYIILYQGKLQRLQESNPTDHDNINILQNKIAQLKEKLDSIPPFPPRSRARPNHFSRVATEILHAPPTEEFPLLQKATRITVEIKAGEMLYLPAGWFHEVTSYNDSGNDVATHLAFNYWAPPPTNKNYDSPYDDEEFWHDVMRQVTELLDAIAKKKAEMKQTQADSQTV